MKTLSEQLCQAIQPIEENLNKKRAELQNISAILRKARGQFSKKPWPVRDAQRLLETLGPRADESMSELHDLLATIKRTVDEARMAALQSFDDELSRAAKASGIVTGIFAGKRFLGEFGLSTDLEQESADLLFGHVPACSSLPMEPGAIIKALIQLRSNVSTAIPDASKLAADFEEALKITLIRMNKPIGGRELRSPLPELYREMFILRQDRGKTLSWGRSPRVSVGTIHC